MSETLTPHFLTPEEAAPIFGTTKTTLKRYARLSGHCTRLERNRIAFDQDNLDNLHSWLKEQQKTPAPPEPGEEIDYFDL